MMLDEIDRYPVSAGAEGDPCALAIRRTESFWNSVIVLTSTPTIKGMSRIENEFQQSDQRYWFVPCPACHKFQTLKWKNVHWPDGKPEETWLECEECGTHLNDRERVAMVKAGEWRATAGFSGKRGYHLNGIYSPFKQKKGFKNRLHQMAAQFLEAKHGGEQTIKTWVNTFLAETWEAEGETIATHDLLSRREDYIIPEKCLVFTWAADVQSDRIEAEILGWGVGEECWSIKRGYFIGDVKRDPNVWKQLFDFITQKIPHPKFGDMRLECGCVDSGYATQQAYEFVKRCQPLRVHAIKGALNRLRLPVEAPRRRGRSSALLVDTVEFKSTIYARLKQTVSGPNFMHFPREYDEEYFLQLTAEKVVTKFEKGVKKQSWENVRPNKRNEALDIRVYNHAALFLLSVNWERLEKSRQTPKIVPSVAEARPPQPKAAGWPRRAAGAGMFNPLRL